jgi:CheY-like chemotaxis protein/two-component sensor histidine kinase
MDVEIGSVRFTDLGDYCLRTFRHVAEGKNLEFAIDLDSSVQAESIHTDAKRLQQVLKNLLSNALKFTERGIVRLRVERAKGGWSASHPALNRAKNVIAFSVTDSGIGIPHDKQRIIFEAFQQADGTTSRKYGGTGLGLSISRELARLLGGEIRLQSAPGAGSTFTLYLPQVYGATTQPSKEPRSSAALSPISIPGAVEPVHASKPMLDVILPAPVSTPTTLVEDLVVDDDRNLVQPGDPVLLIIEDDVTFARILLDLAHDKGLKVLIALRGSTALSLAREFKPGAITLDISLPDMVGWTILDRLKHDPGTRHIPVHIISGDENRRRGLALGAMTYLEKSLTRESLEQAFNRIEQSVQQRVKKLLVVTSDSSRRKSIREIVDAPDIQIRDVSTGGEAMAIIKQQYVDGVIVDLRIPDIPAIQLAQEIRAEVSPQSLPVVLYSKRKLSEPETVQIQQLQKTAAIKHAQSPEQLLDLTVLLLHRAESGLSDTQRTVLAKVRGSDTSLVGKKVLVIDDDLRNIFALTSVLEQHNLQVVHAENGRDGINILRKTPGIDAVLMDIMMPEMDGYETTHAIRKIPEFRSLPIIALTAKAMKGDREKCLQAGASDYVPKPVDLEHLFSVLRVWISRGHEFLQPLAAGQMENGRQPV